MPAIVERARQEHPYEVPGVSTRPIDGGNPEYLQWIDQQTRERLPGGGHEGDLRL